MHLGIDSKLHVRFIQNNDYLSLPIAQFEGTRVRRREHLSDGTFPKTRRRRRIAYYTTKGQILKDKSSTPLCRDEIML